MKNIVRFAGVALMALTASTAQAAGEARAEVRGGLAWFNGLGASGSEAVLGVAVGYDFDISDSAFIGVEGSADKVLVSGSDILWGVGGRVGAKLGDATRLYAAGGLGFGGGDTAPYLGVGAQQKFGGSFYGKLEYRRYFDIVDINTLAVGVGMTF
ncbi:outer membrane beta-barrel protein [Sandarakinorhabdus sp.]|uniref:outer membrane beta-barrel protein n=1 Tax=Sandarakinorhabdus sp. TaxID=1916663 RepID=UPI00286E0ADB|nr:outer membrane beta-barrel protein [Sandarakinorhabdus sp.]